MGYGLVMWRLVPVLVFGVLAGGCDERLLFEGLPPGTPESVPDGDADGDIDGDADSDVDGDADGDALPDPDLQCGYPAAGYGQVEGRNLEPFWLEDCAGEPIHLSELWCDRAATIVHLSVAWCGSCMSSFHRVLLAMEELGDAAVGFVEIVLEDEPGEVAGELACNFWNDLFELEPNTAYVPPDATLEGALADLGTTNAVPLLVILDSTGRIRYWGGSLAIEDIVREVRALLD